MIGFPPLRFQLFLSSRLQSRSQCKGLHDLPGGPHATGHIQDGFVGDDVGEAVDLSEELSFGSVDIFPLP